VVPQERCRWLLDEYLRVVHPVSLLMGLNSLLLCSQWSVQCVGCFCWCVEVIMEFHSLGVVSMCL
jgi:hypothetical protein